MTGAAKRLFRSRSDRMLAGVCGGLGEYLNVDPTLVRILWVVLSIFPGTIIGGVLVYVVLAVIVPEEPVTAGAQAWPPPPYSPPTATNPPTATPPPAPPTPPPGEGSP